MQISSKVQRRPFYVNRNFGLLWAGQIISSVGDTFFDTTLVLWITTVIAKDQQWAPLAVGGVFFAVALSTLVVGPIAGVFVDRWEKRRTLLLMDVLRAILVVLLFLTTFPLPFLPGGQLPSIARLILLYIIVALVSGCTQFFYPARMALVGDVVEKADLTRASGLAQTSMNLSNIIGPPLAAPFFFLVGAQGAFLINVLSFGISFVAILAVRVPVRTDSAATKEQHDFWHDFVGGLAFFRSNRVLITALISLMLTYIGSTALNTVAVFFVTQNLHVALNLYGTLDMAFGIGSLVGAFIATILVQRIGLTRAIWSSLLLLGFWLFLYARMTNYIPALCIMFLIGPTLATLGTAFSPLVLHVTPREFTGRVLSVFPPCTSLVAIVTSTTTGYLASTVLHNFHAQLLGISFNPIDTILSVTAILVLSGGVYALINLWDVRIDTERPEQPEKRESEEVTPSV